MIVARGVRGELRVGYHVAAWLGAWEVTIAEDRFVDGRWTATAEVLGADQYLLEAGGQFELRLAMGERWWVWADVGGPLAGVGRGPLTIRGRGGPQVG